MSGTGKEMSCKICGKRITEMTGTETERSGKTYRVLYCGDCSIGYTVLVPSPEELARLYAPGKYREESGNRFRAAIELLIRLFRIIKRRRVGQYVQKGAVLDVGCGRGLFLSLMKQGGWDVMGIEFDESTALSVSRSFDIPVTGGGEKAFRELESGRFDVITINHVLEHMLDPESTLTEVSRLLRDKGLLTVSVPDIASLQASFGKKDWFHLDIPYHVVHFSEKGLKDLLKKHSFRIRKIRRFNLEYNPFGWFQTLLNKSGLPKNLFYDLLKSGEMKGSIWRKITFKDLALHVLLIPLYLPLSFLLAFIESFVLRRGGTVEIFAVKEQDSQVEKEVE